MVVVNQSIFLLRDNIIFCYNTFDQSLQHFFFKGKVTSLFKLKQSSENEQGYKQTLFKVIALQRNGQLAVFLPNDSFLMKDWFRQDQLQTPMFEQKELIQEGFQNQNNCNYLYISTHSSTNEQKLY